MRKAFIAASAVALALGGCSTVDSMFHKDSNTGTAVNTAPPQAPRQVAQASPPSYSPPPAAATEQSGSSHRARSTASGMTADEVRQAQQKLKDDGDYTADVDGKFGPKTAQAVKQFQQKNGLRQTGRLDGATMSKLGVGGMTGSGSSSSGMSGSGSSMSPANNSPTGSEGSAPDSFHK